MKTLAQDIKSGNFKNAYLICGEEEYLKLNYKNQLIKAIAGEDTMNLALYEGKNIDINEVIDNAETFPFFAKYRLIVLEQSGLSIWIKFLKLPFFSLWSRTWTSAAKCIRQ